MTYNFVQHGQAEHQCAHCLNSMLNLLAGAHTKSVLLALNAMIHSHVGGSMEVSANAAQHCSCAFTKGLGCCILARASSGNRAACL